MGTPTDRCFRPPPGFLVFGLASLLLASCGEERYRPHAGERAPLLAAASELAGPVSTSGRLVLRAGRAEPVAARPRRLAAAGTRDVSATVIFQQGLQPDTSYQHAGTTAWAYWPDDNYGDDEYLALGANGNVAWFYLQFDLAGHLPEGAQVQQATLSLYAYDAYGYKQSAAVRRVLDSWEEMTLTYNNRPALDVVGDDVYVEDFNRWWDWDVTDLVADWAADPAGNHGLAVFPTNDTLYDGDWLLWCSDDHSSVSLRPRLTVDYLLPEHRAAFVSQQPPPATMFITQRAPVQLVFRNDGVDTWSTAAGYALGSQAPQDNDNWGSSRVALPADVPAGGQAVFSFEVVAPGQTGTYTFQWRLVHEGVAWFGDTSPAVDVQVTRKPDGSACNDSSECDSGECVDDVCCDAACGGLCRRCDLPGREGICSYLDDGSDPDEECPGSGPCGAVCDGAGQCRYPSAATRCATCAACDGNGNCNQFDPAGSDPLDACPVCQACPGDGPDCLPVAAGSDPLDDCPDNPPQSCSTSGACDGAGHCLLWPAGTECGPESCQQGVHEPADTCDGAGNCVDAGQESCAPYVCLDAVSCRSDCSSDGDCVGDSRCSAGQCIAYLQRGEPCQSDEQCISGFCSDGVCCDSRCASPCFSCALAADPGGCLPVPDGQDPRDDCAGQDTCGGVCDGSGGCRFPPAGVHCGECLSCDGLGACSQVAAAGSDPFDECPPCHACSGGADGCRPVAAGEDPLDDCPDDPPESCGFQGTCNGSGGCPLWPAGTVCQQASCAEGILQPEDLCDGQGNCQDSGSRDCAGFACADEHGCRSSCQQDEHCLPGYFCQAGACLPVLEPGAACQRPAQCASGFCTDGVCCAEECAGTCQRCDAAAAPGNCTFVTAGEDPDNECGGQGACGGSCDGQGGCSLPGPEKACGPCARCDGQGGCTVLLEAGSDPDDACGPCRVCAGDRDECVPVPAGEDPLDECPGQPAESCQAEGSCDGRGSCRLWPAGTTCAPAACRDETMLEQVSSCDGQGSCLPGGQVDCSPGQCQQDACTGPEGLHHVTVEDAPGGGGQPIGDLVLTADEELVLYAVGRAEDGSFLGDVVVSWSVQGQMGTVVPGPDRSTRFSATTVGSGTVLADFADPAVADGSSGTLTVVPGVARGEIPLHPEPATIPADGASTSLVRAGPVRDADGNLVADGSAFDVLLEAGRLLGDDDDPQRPGFQRVSREGEFLLVVQAAEQPAVAGLAVSAVPPGQARGSTSIVFGPGKPVARAGADQSVFAGARVQLDGSASFDPRGRTLGFSWNQQAGPQIELQDADGAWPWFYAPRQAGQERVILSLVVSAGADSSEPDDVEITVQGPDADSPRAVIAAEPVSGPAPLQVSLDGSSSSAAAGAELVAYRWDFSDGQDARFGPQVDGHFAGPGTVQVTLTVIDSAGRSDSARQAIVVRDGELLPPQVTLEAHPPRGEVPLRVFLLARASDADGTVERLEWNLGAGFAEGPAELWHTFTRPGRYPVVVRASDDDGLTALAALEVEVGREGQWPPFIYSEPVTEARVGRDYSYQPLAAGSPPLEWSLGKEIDGRTAGAPAGMSIDPATGLLQWTPREAAAEPVAVTVTVRNQAGADFQDFHVQVGGQAAGGCGCQGGGPAGRGAGLLVMLLLLARRRRRAA